MSFAPNAIPMPAPVRTLLLSASIVTLAFAAGAARAATQADTATGTTVTQADGTGGNQEILVTATRRAESAKNVPIAVSVLSGEKLDTLNSSGLDIRFLSSRVPSLQIESSFGRTFPRFYIRGLGNTDFDPNSAQPVSVVYDDVALESPLLKSFPVFDLQSVEVLRGPQGTLFGRNTPAGVVKLNSAAPSDTIGGYISGEYGTYNTVNVEGAFTGPLAEGLSMRVSGLLQRRDNWVHNDSSTGFADKNLEGYNDMAARLQFAYTSGDFNALLNVHGRDLVGTPRVFRAGLFEPGSNHFSAGFSPSHVALDDYTSQTLHQYGTNLHLDYGFEGIGRLYSITAYEAARVESTGDIDGGNSYPYTGGTLGDLNVGGFEDVTGGVTKPKEFSQELRFQSEEFGGLRFQGGGYYFHQHLSYSELAYATPLTGSRANDLNQDYEHRDTNENIGVFGSVEYKPVDKLTLRAGVRWSHDHKNDLVFDGMPHGVTSANLFGYALPVRAKVSASDVTWDASATYALSNDINLYARAATGYLGPAIQDRVNFGSFQNTAKKETTISGEGGIKGALFDHGLNFSLDGYWYRTKNFQLTAVGGATNSAQLLSADHVIGYGAEAEIDIRPVKNLTLTASGSYNFTKIHDPDLVVGVCGGGCTVTDPLNAAGNAFIDGNPLPQAPRYIANATARYDVPLANGDKVFFFTDWAYRSSINYFLYTAKEFRGRALTEGGLKLGYDHKNMEFAVYVRNVLNQIRSISAIDFNNLTGMINDPRIVGGQVRVTF